MVPLGVTMSRTVRWSLFLAGCLTPAFPGAPAPSSRPAAPPALAGSLKAFDAPLQDLAAKASRAVVQIQVSGLFPVPGRGPGDASVVERQRAIGSGVILDPEGYILTNAHVVEGAQRIRVLPCLAAGAPASGNRALDAVLVGLDKATDLALIKIEGHGLPALKLGDERPVHPGELVLAVGSPEGLQNSVTLGIVSSVHRQANPEHPMEYLQTDAPINHGNSGGPLVDTEGFVIGLNTFILSEGGGSEGLGFAIPAPTLRFVYDRLRKDGQVRRAAIQAAGQDLTPALAAGLKLGQDWGVVIADVAPGGPAESGGLQARDIVTAVDGRAILDLPGLTTAMSLHPLDRPVELDVLRGTARKHLTIPALPARDGLDSLASLAKPANRVRRLGIFGLDYSEDLAGAFPRIRIPSGVVVLALSPGPSALSSELRPGDLIHAFNDVLIATLEQLKTELAGLQPGGSGVLTVERDGGMKFVVLETD